MRQVTLNISDAVYDHVMFFLKKLDKQDINIKEENMCLSIEEKEQIIAEVKNSGISSLTIKEIVNESLKKIS